MIVYVRAKKDRDAILHVFERFYGYVPDVRTLGGVRGEELVRAIEEIPAEDFTLVLLGKEDRKWVKEDLSNTWMKVEFFEKAKVRNGRQHQIYWLIERAKARFITDVKWEETYVLGRRGFVPPRPGTDVFLGYWEEYKHVLSELLGRDVGTPLVVHRGNRDTLFAGNRVIAEVDRDALNVKDYGAEPVDVNVRELLKENRDYVEEKVRITVEKIRKVCEGREVVVPFSGGKDSLTVLTLLEEAGEEFTPVFVDTGGEFEQTVRAAERVGAEIVEAPVAKKYRERGDDYLKTRACTRDKIGTLYAYIRVHFDDPVVVNGDRIPESRQRSERPEIRRDEFTVFSPIKYWSYMDEQLYLLSRKKEINELYRRGFYRIGCVFCPFMDKFERWVLATTQRF